MGEPVAGPLAAVLAGVAGYLIGSLPIAAWVARLRGQRIFEVGSGNMGAMNTARNLGLAAGAAVLILDVAKGAAATLIGLLLAGLPPLAAGAAPPQLAVPLAAGLGAILGHGFSLFAGFRGGKGLAAAFGAGLPLYPAAAGAGGVLLIAMTLLMRKRSGVAAVISVTAYPFLATATLLALGAAAPRALTLGAGIAAVAAVVLLRHFLAFRRERARQA
ncbi:MAG TPA: glycerol-3-phosphate acyltransferase [Trueperaceae bacterium]|nr:glycerol-3-phosphate acyltransferase [Trueperaceae bacterium]